MSDTITPDPTTVTIHVSTPTGPRAEVMMIVIPADYALLEELALAVDEDDPVLTARVGAAMLALCCPALGRMCARAGIDYAKHGYSPVSYGRAVYTWLHGQGVPVADVVAAREVLRPLIARAAWPREAEVEAEMGKSGASAAS